METISDSLKSYFENKFLLKGKNKYFLKEDGSVTFWEDFLDQSAETDFEILKNFYPQLSFPVEAGINRTSMYIDAVLKGKSNDSIIKSGLKLNQPDRIKIKIHHSVSGKIPVLVVPDDEDFKKVIQSLLYKNDPLNIPSTMGAVLINGINNWSRIHHLKKRWHKNNLFGDWNEEFSKKILPNFDLYKDKLIILSTKYYSNVKKEKADLSDAEWLSNSLLIRLEHECTHLYTLKRYGCASNNLHDELVADYIGLAKTFGYFDKNLMLAFMGLEDYPDYRKGSRLENYLASAVFSDDDFEKLVMIIKNAIENISIFDNQLGKINSDHEEMCRIESLCETSLLKIASREGSGILIKKYQSIRWRASKKITLL